MTSRKDDWVPEIADPEVQKYIFEEAGEEGLEMAQFISENEPIGGVDVLESFPDRKPSAVRKVLYRLMEARVAEYEKDTDAKGWETFVWRMTLNEVKYVLRRRWQDEMDHLQTQLRFEQDHEFYVCHQLHRRMVFEDALEVGFHCPVCGELMEPVDTAPVEEALRDRMAALAPRFEA